MRLPRCRRCDHVESDHSGGNCALCLIRGAKCYHFRAPLQTRVNRVSKRRSKVNRLRAKAQIEAWGPRPWACEFPDYVKMYFNAGLTDIKVMYSVDTSETILRARECYGEVNGHEIHSRARNGTDENLIEVRGQAKLCNFHNEWCASHSIEAEMIGLSI